MGSIEGAAAGGQGDGAASTAMVPFQSLPELDAADVDIDELLEVCTAPHTSTCSAPKP